MRIEDLTPYERYSLGDARRRLHGAGYELAYGSTYTIMDIRKAILDKQPAFVSIGGRTYLAVGENPDSLILHRKGKLHERTDQEIRKAFTGDAVIVQKGPDQVLAGNEFIILSPERDTWPSELLQQKQRTIGFLNGIKQGAPWLPDHPVILTFQKPTPAQVKRQVRASTIGVEITINDPSDPVTDFLHELGHIYWDNRLTSDEKKAVKEYHREFKKDAVPPIYTSKSWYKDAEELFATLYMFCVKARTVNPGYARLLDIYEPLGRDLMNGIFARVESDQAAAEAWEGHAETLSKALERYGSSRTYRVQGKGCIHARGPLGEIPEDIIFPRSVPHKVLDRARDGIEWVQVQSGPLVGREIALKNGLVHIGLTKTATRAAVSPEEAPKRKRILSPFMYVFRKRRGLI